MKLVTGLNTLASGVTSRRKALDTTEHHSIPAIGLPEGDLKSARRVWHFAAFAIVPTALVLVGTLNAQKPRDTKLFLDSVPADSVHCGGLTVQFARFFIDFGKHPIVGENIEGSQKNSIDIWIWNRTDSARTYDPKMFKAINDQGNQVNFWSADEIADYLASLVRNATPDVLERVKYRTRSRSEYQAGAILPGASGGPRILVPDKDKNLDKGISLYCRDTKLGFLHRK